MVFDTLKTMKKLDIPQITNLQDIMSGFLHFIDRLDSDGTLMSDHALKLTGNVLGDTLS